MIVLNTIDDTCILVLIGIVLTILVAIGIDRHGGGGDE